MKSLSLKSKLTLIFSFCIFVLSLCFICLFKSSGNTSVWKGWRVLAVENTISESEVLGSLEKVGIKNVVSVSGANAKVTSQFVPVLPSFFDSYSDECKNYFTSYDNNFNIYYIKKPVSVQKLKKLPFMFSLDLPKENLFFLPFVSLAFAVVLVFFHKNKIKYSLLSLPFVVLSFFSASLPSFFVSLFAFTTLLLFSFLEGRTNAFFYCLKNPFLLISVAASFASSVFGGWKMVLLYCAACICCASIFVLYDEILVLIEANSNKTGNFRYVKIVGARFCPKMNQKSLYAFYGLSALVLICGVLSCVIPAIKNDSSFENRIPSPEKISKASFNMSGYQKTAKKASELPNLSDYVERSWNARKIGFSSLNSDFHYDAPVSKNQEVYETEYVLDGENIVETENKVLQFDNKFIRSSIKSLKEQESLTIESVLLDQGSFYQVKFRGSKNNTVAYIILTVMGLFFSVSVILLFFGSEKLGFKKRATAISE